jgi:hypothetical protein
MENKEKLKMKIVSKNRLFDLNDHLFEELERLNDEELKGEALQEERERAKAIANIAQRIINNGELAFKTIKYYNECGEIDKIPKPLQIGEKNET